VLHRIWAGAARGGISSLAELERIGDLPEFVRGIVGFVIRESLRPGGRNSLPARFPDRLMELEAERLTVLVSEWLDYERLRQPFTVAETEDRAEVTVAGLKLRLRLDRVDHLEDGSQLVIDYKSSEVGPSAWVGDRPDDVQLPLYATFAVQGELEGLVFGRVRPGDSRFLGRVRNAATSLLPGLASSSGLVKDPLTDVQLDEWRKRIERLGDDFLTGRADVDPKDPVKVCGKCHLHAVCRIYENQPLAALPGEDDEDNAEDGLGADGQGMGDGDA
jgi:ATP-dependent helicase/nuclease subunit B